MLDFASAHLDAPPDFPEEVWEEWRADKAEQFGEKWEIVDALFGTLRIGGIYRLDPSPTNLQFD